MDLPLTQTTGGRVTLQRALSAPPQKGRQSSLIFERGDLEVRFYCPRGTDDQQPHTRDEVYVIARGQGFFLYDSKRVPFQPGDLLFVAAGIEHRFVDFTDDFATWVLFFGEEGGDPGSGIERRSTSGLSLVPDPK